MIKRRTNDGIYFCQLSLRKGFNSETLFRLGEAHDAEKYKMLLYIYFLQKNLNNYVQKKRYIQQYVRIFTEEGRRPVTIKHILIERLHSDYKSFSNSKNSDISSIECKNASFSSSTLNKSSNNSPATNGISFNYFLDPNSKLVS